MPLQEAIRTAGLRRFRAVFLVSSTTMLGLVPIIAERSLQAQFLIPMAVALGFGTMFSSSISLILVPSLYHILEDIKAYFAEFFGLFSRRPGQAGAEGASVASIVDRTFSDDADQSGKLQWHVGLDEAYDIGYQAALEGKPRKAPFDLEVLSASWEAGWDDGREEVRLKDSGATE
jgi:ribosome modulation factor